MGSDAIDETSSLVRRRSRGDDTDAFAPSPETGLANDVDSLSGLRRRIVEVRDDERRAIASTLHDTTSQLLTVAALGIDRARMTSAGNEQLASILADVRKNISDAQRQIADLTYMIYPQRLSESGLTDTLREICEGFARRSGLTIRSETSDSSDCQTPEVATVIVRIVQEALTNVCKHAAAKSAFVCLYRDGNISKLVITDDGKGFASNNAGGAIGIGLTSCRDRAESIGGHLEIKTGESGSAVVVTLP